MRSDCQTRKENGKQDLDETRQRGFNTMTGFLPVVREKTNCALSCESATRLSMWHARCRHRVLISCVPLRLKVSSKIIKHNSTKEKKPESIAVAPRVITHTTSNGTVNRHPHGLSFHFLGAAPFSHLKNFTPPTVNYKMVRSGLISWEEKVTIPIMHRAINPTGSHDLLSIFFFFFSLSFFSCSAAAVWTEILCQW